ncbi:MAG: N-6 DNA methylase [Prevotellaceae bacterium]|jgi:type I restriction-modification system DNA methylase subunit|nr:N-6 DNA methylase [Prevotellaceae bacterium]
MYNIKSKILEQMRFIGNDIANDSDFMLQEIKKSFAFINYIFYYDKSKLVKTRFYWIITDNLSDKDLRDFHKYIWNKNNADLLFIEHDNTVEIKYVNTPPKQDLITIDKISISSNTEDTELLNKISKEHITTGAFWIEYKDALDRIKKQHQTVDEALVRTLTTLRGHLDAIYLSSLPDEKQRGGIVQALIDRTLFVKFLEDKKIINSDFYRINFGSPYIYYKDLLEQKDAQKINKLFSEINKTFNNKLFETPEIKDSDLLDNALIEIANAIKGTSPDGQLSLFDFQFDIIPVEFISHIYQIFLDNKKAEQGIFYTPEGLAKLIVENVIEKRQAGTVLDPSCGSGIFLVLAFRQMYNFPEYSNIYEEIQQRLQFIKDHIFGIELENTAARLAVFSLYLEVLKDIPAEELNKLVTKLIQDNSSKTLFSVDFSDNIKEQNALIEGKYGAFNDQTFDYIIGNPPWFIIGKDTNDSQNTINEQYWNKYKKNFSDKQISQAFFHRIKFWEGSNTRYGFVMNSSNFQNDSDRFEKFFFENFSLLQFYELTKIKKILFKFAKEPACIVIFQKKTNSETFQYIAPELNSFAVIFKTILLQQDDMIEIYNNDILSKKVAFRDFLVGSKSDISMISKLLTNSNCQQLYDITKKDATGKPFVHEGMKLVGEQSACKEFSISKKEWSNYSETQKEQLYQTFKDKYSRSVQSMEYSIKYIAPKNLKEFSIIGQERFLPDKLPNFERKRDIQIYEDRKILWNRTSNAVRAAFVEDKIYYSFDIYVLKLQNDELYPLVTAIINSKLAQYYWKVKSRKRVEGSFPKINSNDFLSLPIPKNIENNTAIIRQLQQLSTVICEGTYSFTEKENEINELVYDLYDLTYIERQRISDFFIPNTQKVTKKNMENYCSIFDKTIRRYLKTGIISMEYSCSSNLPFDVAGIKITLGHNDNLPAIKEVNKVINYQLLKQVGNSPILALKQRIYAEDCIYIIKDTKVKSWTESAAFDDARVEIDKLYKNE